MRSKVSIKKYRRSRPVTVLVFGTFDLLHAGHYSFLRQAKRLGSKLIVAVGRNHVVAKLKGRPPIHGERQRLRKVRSLPLVHRAILASRNPKHRFRFIRKLNPDVIALGYDQSHYTENLKAELRQHGIRAAIVRLKSHKPQRFKSSLIRKRLAPKPKS